MEFLPVAVIRAEDPACHRLTGNLAAHRLLGVPVGAGLSKSPPPGQPGPAYRTLQDGAEVPPDRLPMQTACRTGEEVRDAEYEIALDGGESRHILCYATPLFDGPGRVRGCVFAALDITERKKAEGRLRASEGRFRLAAEAVNGLIYDYDVAAGTVWRSSGLKGLVGYAPDEAEPTPDWWFRLAHPDDVRGGERQAADLYAGSAATFDAEYRVRHRDGHSVHVWERGQVVRGADGRPVRVVGSTVDVTARKEAERATADARRRFERIAEATPDLIYLFDVVDRRNLYANHAVGRLLGLTPERVRGMGDRLLPELVHPDDWPTVERAYRDGAALADGAVLENEYRLRHADGTYRWVLGRDVVFARTPDGHPHVMLGVVQDITARKEAEERLRASEERYRTLFESMDEGYCVIEMIFDPPGGDRAVDYRFREVNPAFEAQAGMRAVTGRRMREFVADIEDHWLANYGRVARTGEPVRFAAEYTGLGRWFEVYAFRVGGDGSPRVGVLFTDITARKRAEAESRSSAERLVAALDASGTGTFRWDPATGEFLEFDDRLRRLFGFRPDEPVRTTEDILARVHPDDATALASAVAACREGADFEMEYRVVRPGGEVRWLYDRAGMVRAGGGGPLYLVGACTDITPRKVAEEEFHRSRSRLDLVVNSVDIGLWYCDLPFDRLVWNAKVKEHFGLPADCDVTIDTFYERLHPDDRDRTRRAIDRSVRDRAGYDIEYRTVGPDGRERWVRAIGRTFYAPSGEPVSFDGITVDVTERVRQQEALKDADRRKDEFLATLAHELRNPLAPLRNGLQVMKLAAGDPGAVERARSMMDRQLGQMVHLIDDLLDVSRITRGKLQLRRQRVELASVVRAAVETARPVIEASAHELATALPPEPVWLDADPTRLAQVLSNLLANAAKYTERGGRVRLAAARDGGEVVVSVADTGIGIAPEHLPRLFEMFSQVPSALERSQGGLGIGLALVKGLAEMHGGTVAARSDGPGKGSEFVVRLPVAGGTPAGRSQAAPGEPAAARPRRRVLVADDNRDAADSLAEMLRIGGHEVHTAYAGRAAVEAAARLRPDVAVLDIGMPGLTGYDAARRIRSESWGRDITLVALTGWGQEEDKRRATGAGFDHHLTKPVDPAALERLLAGLRQT